MDTTPHYQFEPFPENSLFEGAWFLSLPPGEAVEEIAPDGCCELIVHLGRPPIELRDDGQREQPDMLIYGPLTRVLKLRPRDEMRMMGLRFRPWAIGAFSVDPYALRNQAQPVEAALGAVAGRTLKSRALEGFDAFARSGPEILSPLAQPPQAQALLGALDQHLDEHPQAGISDLVSWSGRTQRTLARYYRRCAGLTPGEYLRLRRFQQARAAIKAGRPELTMIALEAGYADQAHMTREFRKLAGRTPAQTREEAGFDPLYEDQPGQAGK